MVGVGNVPSGGKGGFRDRRRRWLKVFGGLFKNTSKPIPPIFTGGMLYNERSDGGIGWVWGCRWVCL